MGPRRFVPLVLVVVVLAVFAPAVATGSSPDVAMSSHVVAGSSPGDVARSPPDDSTGSPGDPARSPPDDARLTVTDVTVTPATPVTDEPVTMAVSLRNSAASPSAVAVNNVTVVTETNETVARTTDPGTLSQGDTLTVPLTASFEEPGVKRLTVVAVGTDSEGNLTRVRRPLSVVVERAPPQIDLSVRRPVAGDTTQVTVAVSNPTTAEVRNLTVLVDGAGLAPVDERTTIPDLAAGETQEVNLTVRPGEAGQHIVAVTVEYTTAAGVPASTTREQTVAVASLETDVGVAVAPAPQEDQAAQVTGGISGVLGGATTEQDEDGPPTEVEVTVTNFGNAPVRGVVVRPSAGDRSLSRRSIPDPIPPGESATVTVDLSDVQRSGAVEFEVRYRTGGEDHTATGVYDYRPGVGQVTITGVELTREGDRVRISGNAGNVGNAEVTGVVLSVGETATVTPTYPQRNYFAGTIEGSEFAPFELTARIDGENATSVPIEVQYRVDGVAYNRTVDVPYDRRIDREKSGGGGGFLSPFSVGIGAVVLLSLGIGAVALRRRFRGQ